MRRLAFFAVLAAATIAVVAGAALAGARGSAAGTPYTIVFGRTGGNIAPASVTIARNGAVTARGTMQRDVRTAVVPPATLARIARMIAGQRFFALPSLIRCPGVLPDFAASYITVTGGGKSKTTTVRGDCNTRFQKLYKTLTAAVGTGG